MKYRDVKQWKSTFTLLVLVGLLSACTHTTNPLNPQIDTIAGELPLLIGDNRIGIIRGFNPSNPPETLDAMNARWDDAIHAGMTVGRLLQIDWPELEPSPNRYDKGSFEESLMEMKAEGLQTFLLISAYDNGGPVVPNDLKEKDVLFEIRSYTG